MKKTANPVQQLLILALLKQKAEFEEVKSVLENLLYLACIAEVTHAEKLEKPVKYIDPDGNDIILVNRSYGAFKEGHNAVLIGSDEGGWIYFSKDGSNTTNRNVYFRYLKDFIAHNKKLDKKNQYDRAYRVGTDRENDLKMIKKGKYIYNRKYSISEKKDKKTGEIYQNCADLCADIVKEGNVSISKPKHFRFPVGKFTKPNFQYEDFKNKNKGKEIKIK